MINLESESEITTESNCTIIKINQSFYTLNYKLKDNINGDLQSAISFINDEEILLVNFDSGNSTIKKIILIKNIFQKLLLLNQVKLLLLFCLLFLFWLLLLVLLFT